jgi:hypothetical protein
MSIGVIGAGFGRTGTLSFKAALEELGFAPCWHIEDMMKGARKPDSPLLAWQRLADGGAMDWPKLLNGYRAVTDHPICLYYRDLMAAFPAAKVVLTLRDPLSWAQSIRALRQHFLTLTSGPGMDQGPGKIWHDVMETLVWSKFGDLDDDAALVAKFNRHADAVRADVPSDRPLVFDVREGWAPLCRFLNVAEPATPFPHLNERSSLKKGAPRPDQGGASGR